MRENYMIVDRKEPVDDEYSDFNELRDEEERSERNHDKLQRSNNKRDDGFR